MEAEDTLAELREAASRPRSSSSATRLGLKERRMSTYMDVIGNANISPKATLTNKSMQRMLAASNGAVQSEANATVETRGSATGLEGTRTRETGAGPA